MCQSPDEAYGKFGFELLNLGKTKSERDEAIWLISSFKQYFFPFIFWKKTLFVLRGVKCKRHGGGVKTILAVETMRTEVSKKKKRTADVEAHSTVLSERVAGKEHWTC